jgi:hypothetical protein
MNPNLILCQLQLQIVRVQKKSVNATGTALNAYAIIKKETKTPTAPVADVNRKADLEPQKKRQHVQIYFGKMWAFLSTKRVNIVNATSKINCQQSLSLEETNK